MWRKQSQHSTAAFPWDFLSRSSELDAALDSLLKLLPNGVVGEILYYAPRPKCLITLAIRPDTAVLLPTRLREQEGLAGRVLATSKAFGGPVESKMGARRQHSTRSALTLPIRRRGKGGGNLLGVISFESHDEAQLTEQSGAEFEEALSRIAVALESIPTSAFPDDASVKSYLQGEIEREIAYILDPEQIPEIYRQFCQATSRLTSQPDSDMSIILKRQDAQDLGFVGETTDPDETQQEWVVPVPNVDGASGLPGGWDLLAEPSITQLVMKSGKREYIPDVTAPSEQTRRKPLPPPFDHGSELNYPITDMDGTFGTIIMLSPHTHAFTQDDERMVAAMARYIATVTRRIESFRRQTQPGEENDWAKSAQRVQRRDRRDHHAPLHLI